MNDAELKKAFEQYRKRVKRSDVVSAITGKGLSASFAERAAKGEWKAKRIQDRTRDALMDILGLKAS